MYPSIRDPDYWALEESPREHCYWVVPLKILGDAREMTVHGFELVYLALGKLGYRFRDAGHDHLKVIISLDKPVSSGDLEKLAEKFWIMKDSGVELSGI